MSPQEWTDFEERIKKRYEEMTIYELMNEENNLAYVLSNPHKFPRLQTLDFDKLNCQLRIVGEVFIGRIDKIIARSEKNGSS